MKDRRADTLKAVRDLQRAASQRDGHEWTEADLYDERGKARLSAVHAIMRLMCAGEVRSSVVAARRKRKAERGKKR